MKKLLQETLEALKIINKTPDDIIFIGIISKDGDFAYTWKEFEELANKEYDDCSTQEATFDLTIMFEDCVYLIKQKDGGWEYNKLPISKPNNKPIKRIFSYEADADDGAILNDLNSEFKKLKEEYNLFYSTFDKELKKFRNDVFEYLKYIITKLPFENIKIEYRRTNADYRKIPSILGLVISVTNPSYNEELDYPPFSGKYKYFTIYTIIDEQQIYIAKGESIYNKPVGIYNFKSDKWNLWI